MRTSMTTWAVRVGTAAAGVVAALVVAGVAYAHVEVQADPAVGGAPNAVVTFTAEAESFTAGIASVRVVLPAGIGNVSLKNAPTGWTLTPTADGYQVAGTALPKGQQAVHSITVAHLPNVAELTFKTLVTYSDGSVDRWIGERSAANPDPDNPAPILRLAPGEEPITDAPPPPTAAASPTPTAAAVTPAAAGAGTDDDNTWLWWVLGAVLVVLGAGAALLIRRRSKPTDGDDM
jgi:hypothetical protein